MDDAFDISNDPVQRLIQTTDDDYFKDHPGDDYYVRKAVKGEVAAAGFPDYDGMMLVYRLIPEVRFRRPVAGIEQAIEFVVEFEKVASQAYEGIVGDEDDER